MAGKVQVLRSGDMGLRLPREWRKEEVERFHWEGGVMSGQQQLPHRRGEWKRGGHKAALRCSPRR